MNSSPKLYWKKLRIEQEALHKMVDEKKKIYATHVAGATAPPKGEPESYDPIKHITTVTYENASIYIHGQPSSKWIVSISKKNSFSAEDIISLSPAKCFLQRESYGS